MYGSTGRSCGLDDEVDVVIEERPVQVKARKTLPKWLKTNVDILVIKEDRKEPLAVIPLRWLLAFILLEKRILDTE